MREVGVFPSRMKLTRTGFLISTAPTLLALGMFFSLGVHMYLSLGGWPLGIGEVGFSRLLRVHSTVATMYFWLLWVGCLFGWPVALVAGLAVKPWRPLLVYSTVLVGVFALGVVLMRWLAPAQYLYWWWD